MAEDGYIFLDGSQIRKALPELEPRVAKRFADLDVEGKGLLTGKQAKEVADAEATILLLGVELPAERLDGLFEGIVGLQDELKLEDFWGVVEKYLGALADDLQGNRLVVSALDGSAIRDLLEDEDDFAVLAETLFTKLDLDENGKLSRSELQPALLQLGVELGVPTPAEKPEAETLLADLFKKHGAEGEDEIGQTQFANLLQDMLEDLASTLEANPVIVQHPGFDPERCVKAPALEEILADDAKVNEIAEGFFRALDVNQDGKLDREEVKPLFMVNSQGLPPLVAEQQAQQQIDTVFPEEDAEIKGEINKDDFKKFVGTVLEGYLAIEQESGRE